MVKKTSKNHPWLAEPCPGAWVHESVRPRLSLQVVRSAEAFF